VSTWSGEKILAITYLTLLHCNQNGQGLFIVAVSDGWAQIWNIPRRFPLSNKTG